MRHRPGTYHSGVRPPRGVSTALFSFAACRPRQILRTLLDAGQTHIRRPSRPTANQPTWASKRRVVPPRSPLAAELNLSLVRLTRVTDPAKYPVPQPETAPNAQVGEVAGPTVPSGHLAGRH